MDAKSFINLFLFCCFTFLLRWLVIDAIWNANQSIYKNGRKTAFWKRVSLKPAYWKRKGKRKLLLLLLPLSGK